jgi:hypothetical protein
MPAHAPAHGGRAIYVRGEVNPQIDQRKLAQALLAAVREQQTGYVRPTDAKPFGRRNRSR